jgi:hypothetical protein
MSAVLMKSPFRTGSIVVIVAGALMLFLGDFTDMEGMYMIMGPILMVLGILFLVTGIFSKGVADTNQGRILGLIMILGAVLGIAGIFAGEMGSIVSIAGSVFIILIFLVWPCCCCQSQKDLSTQVIGVASSHDTISIGEISGITGLDAKVVRDSLYEAIGTGRLRGKLEGDTFVRAATTTYAAPTTTTREREIVKVLVICPYCGAKTEQGVGKCQNCQADL